MGHGAVTILVDLALHYSKLSLSDQCPGVQILKIFKEIMHFTPYDLGVMEFIKFW